VGFLSFRDIILKVSKQLGRMNATAHGIKRHLAKLHVEANYRDMHFL